MWIKVYIIYVYTYQSLYRERGKPEGGYIGEKKNLDKCGWSIRDGRWMLWGLLLSPFIFFFSFLFSYTPLAFFFFFLLLGWRRKTLFLTFLGLQASLSSSAEEQSHSTVPGLVFSDIGRGISAVVFSFHAFSFLFLVLLVFPFFQNSKLHQRRLEYAGEKGCSAKKCRPLLFSSPPISLIKYTHISNSDLPRPSDHS